MQGTHVHKLVQYVKILMLFPLFQGCVEEIDIATETFESALVIEGTITTTQEIQKILVGRTFRLESEGPSPEENARVTVTDDIGTEYRFTEVLPGEYHSTVSFGASPERTYTLKVTTQAGGEYISEPAGAPAHSEIAKLYAERIDFNGDDGIAIFVDIESSMDPPEYYRYDFQETYKIISPFSYPYDLRFINGEFVKVEKTKEERICYNTVNSKKIILANSQKEASKDLEGFIVRFIEGKDPILAQRYSILVRQMAISEEAFLYYETLKELSGSQSLFSQNQPGFINGNLSSLSSPGEKVIGYFSVAATDEKRIFFDYEDFFEEGETTDFFLDCVISRPSISAQPLAERLGEWLNSGELKYLGSTTSGGSPGEGPHRVVKAGCVDCTVLGTNVKPAFWIEETENP